MVQGDPIRALQAREMINIIREQNLVQHTKQVGDYVYQGLKTLASTTGSGKLLNLRGKDTGTFIAFDCESPEKRDRFAGLMRSKGVNMGA